MAEKFDPYYKWLGIPPKDQPPHHYRLLGIELFESDRDVIDAAANRLMGYLKELASGDDASHSQKLLNEISRARLCLLNKQKKAAYDKELHENLRADDRMLASRTTEVPPPPQTPQITPPAVEPPAFPGPPKVTEPPRIEIGAIAAQLDKRFRPPPLTTRGSTASLVREAHAPGSEGHEQAAGDQPSEPRRSSKRWMYLAVIGLTAVALVALVVVTMLLPSPGDDSRSKASRNRIASKDSSPWPVLVLVLTEDERKEITAFLLDDKPQALPPISKLTLESGRHRLILRRTGYQEVFDSITLVNGVHREYRPRWRREVASIAPPPAAAPAVAPKPVPPSSPNSTTAELPAEAMIEEPAPASPPSVTEPPKPPVEIPEPPRDSSPPTEAESQAASVNGFTSGFGRLVAHWPFDADTGDTTGLRHDGITIGEASYVDGRAGRALQFAPGLSFEVGAPIFSEASEFSTCLWMNLSSLPAGDGPLINGGKTVIFVRGGFPCVEIGGHKPVPGPNTDETTAGFRGVDLSASLGSWVHLGMTYSARLRQLHFYFNGEHRGCQQYPEAKPASWDRTIITGVSGTLDDLRVFNYRLSHADFKAIVDGSFQPPPAPPSQPDGKLVCETWHDIAPATMRDAIEAALRSKPDQTSTIEESLACVAPVGTGDRLVRIQGFLFPPVTGDYALRLEGSGQATLYLQRSGPGQDTRQEIVANQPGQAAASPRTALESGKACYFEIRHFYKADSGGSLRLGWRLPGLADRLDAIPAAHFGSYRGVL